MPFIAPLLITPRNIRTTARTTARTAAPTKCSLAHRIKPTKPRTQTFNFPVLASDLDGTLLTTSKTIHPDNAAALINAVQTGLHFLPATGKSPSGAFRAMGPLGQYLLHNNLSMGVFLNGLLVKSNTRVIYERVFERHIAQIVLQHALRIGLVPMFYSADTVFVDTRSPITDIFIISHEPVPTPVGDLQNVMSTKLHKALLLDPHNDVRRHRPFLENAFRGVAQITQARPDVLEVLPLGVSKGRGVQYLLNDLGYSCHDLLAVGDNENDVDMIAMAACGVAVGNAVQKVFDVADHRVCHCDDGAVAEALTSFVL